MAADLQRLFLRASADPALRADPRRVHEEYLRATARYGKTWSLPGRQASARKAFAAVDARRAAWRDLTASAASWAAMAASWFWWAYGGGAAFLAGLWRRLRAGAAFLRERLRPEPEPPIDPELRRNRAEVAAGITMTILIPFVLASLVAVAHGGIALAVALAALGFYFGGGFGSAFVRRPKSRLQFSTSSLLKTALLAAFLVQGWSLASGLRPDAARPLSSARAQVERTREILSRSLVNKAADLREFTYSQYLLEGDYSNPEFHLTAELRAAMDLISESPRPWTVEELDALERRLRDSNLQDPLQTPGWIGPVTRVELDAAAALHRLYLEARADPALDPLRLHLAYLEASAPYSVKDAPVLSSLAVDLSGSMRESVSVSATLERRKAGAEAFFARKKKDAEKAFRDFARAEVRERNLRRESSAFAALAAVWIAATGLWRRLRPLAKPAALASLALLLTPAVSWGAGPGVPLAAAAFSAVPVALPLLAALGLGALLAWLFLRGGPPGGAAAKILAIRNDGRVVEAQVEAENAPRPRLELLGLLRAGWRRIKEWLEAGTRAPDPRRTYRFATSALLAAIIGGSYLLAWSHGDSEWMGLPILLSLIFLAMSWLLRAYSTLNEILAKRASWRSLLRPRLHALLALTFTAALVVHSLTTVARVEAANQTLNQRIVYPDTVSADEASAAQAYLERTAPWSSAAIALGVSLYWFWLARRFPKLIEEVKQ